MLLRFGPYNGPSMEHNPYQAPNTPLADPIEPPAPIEIRWACRILWAVLLLSLVMMHPAIRGEWWLVSDADDLEEFWLIVVLVFSALLLCIFAMLIVFIQRRHNWARWVMLLFVVLGLIGLLIDFSESWSDAPIALVADSMLAMAELVACYLLFISAGAKWFSR